MGQHLSVWLHRICIVEEIVEEMILVFYREILAKLFCMVQDVLHSRECLEHKNFGNSLHKDNSEI